MKAHVTLCPATRTPSEASDGVHDERRSRQDTSGSLPVGNLLGSTGCQIRSMSTLGAAAELLMDCERTATVVTDDEGNLVSLLTENDLLRAYFEGASLEQSLESWLASDLARTADYLLRKITLSSSQPLSQVAERMVANALAGDCACHHVVVRDESGKLCGVLSSLDIIRVLCHSQMEGTLSQTCNILEQDVSSVGDLTVHDLMKPREDVFTCLPSNTMREVLKVLLLTHQNSVLVVDEEGIYGIITPRDAVRAFGGGVPSNMVVADWLRGLPMGVSNRLIESDASPAEAAAKMVARGLHHLIAVLPGSGIAVGTISSLDLMPCLAATGSSAQLHALPVPGAGELSEHWHLAPVCAAGATLGQAAMLLAETGRSAVAVTSSSEDGESMLLSENDLMRAFVQCCLPSLSAEVWLLSRQSDRPISGPVIPAHLVVPHSKKLTDAASLMALASKTGREPCHHLVVKTGEANSLGVLSALDVVHALCSLRSKLDLAITGAEDTTVSMIMKPLAVVPACRPTECIRAALSRLVAAKQNAGLVMDEFGFHGLITPRSAIYAFAESAPENFTVASWLSCHQANKGPRYITADAGILHAAELMAGHAIHHLVVADAQGSPLGVLSALDLVRGVASINAVTPFVSLRWLRQFRGSGTCDLWAEHHGRADGDSFEEI
eukprot:TRINITY_DN108570_c0_g1_i1.p1 TRINITY_DN108570_c0_g1~~TRINITY_DN108570_c0_g1_i1.p1  ORF type:complete len:667 (-),score=115.28 TRINITY_DN108570_c0_g1_i1:104-2104(-)